VRLAIEGLGHLLLTRDHEGHPSLPSRSATSLVATKPWR